VAGASPGFDGTATTLYTWPSTGRSNGALAVGSSSDTRRRKTLSPDSSFWVSSTAWGVPCAGDWSTGDEDGSEDDGRNAVVLHGGHSSR
jgi:hypothetical protein